MNNPARSPLTSATTEKSSRGSSRSGNGWRWVCVFFISAICLSGSEQTPPPLDKGAVASLMFEFEGANKLYEQGRYDDAATAYELMLQAGNVSPSLFFNLGNAWFKAGRYGRAIAAYRLGLQLDPRDPSLRFNLKFARKEATGEETMPGSWRERFLANLTINEWTILFSCAFWLWFGLLAIREARPDWRKSIRGYCLSAGVAAGLLFVLLLSSIHYATDRREAVVVVPEAVVRYGPLEESQVRFQLSDGAEVVVTDQKEGDPAWLMVRDRPGREGWLKKDEVILLKPRLSHSGS